MYRRWLPGRLDVLPLDRRKMAPYTSSPVHVHEAMFLHNLVFPETLQRPTAMKVVVIEPKVFEDSENITHQLRDMRPVLINFENTDPHEAARIVDFVSGATFALDGKLEKVGKDIFMCVPVNISIDYSDNDSNKTEQNEYAWDNK